MLKFFNKDGSLSAYSLACGKVQQNIHGVKLWKEHNCYHVLRNFKGTIQQNETDSLTEARKVYRRYTKAAQS